MSKSQRRFVGQMRLWYSLPHRCFYEVSTFLCTCVSWCVPFLFMRWGVVLGSGHMTSSMLVSGACQYNFVCMCQHLFLLGTTVCVITVWINEECFFLRKICSFLDIKKYKHWMWSILDWYILTYAQAYQCFLYKIQLNSIPFIYNIKYDIHT
jgi:hypothetical protein